VADPREDVWREHRVTRSEREAGWRIELMTHQQWCDTAAERLLQAADAGGHHIDVQLADGGTLRIGQRGLDDGVRISHAPTGAEWEFDTVTTQQLITAPLSTAHL
jgi:hypothetical protein